jgi:hypothetical protein
LVPETLKLCCQLFFYTTRLSHTEHVKYLIWQLLHILKRHQVVQQLLQQYYGHSCRKTILCLKVGVQDMWNVHCTKRITIWTLLLAHNYHFLLVVICTQHSISLQRAHNFTKATFRMACICYK